MKTRDEELSLRLTLAERDADIIKVCLNCGQWVRRSNRDDCLNQCIARGFAE